MEAVPHRQQAYLHRRTEWETNSSRTPSTFSREASRSGSTRKSLPGSYTRAGRVASPTIRTGCSTSQSLASSNCLTALARRQPWASSASSPQTAFRIVATGLRTSLTGNGLLTGSLSRLVVRDSTIKPPELRNYTTWPHVPSSPSPTTWLWRRLCASSEALTSATGISTT